MSILVSVIIPTHNRSDLLPRAIHSVLEQSYQDLECIVVNDMSEDITEQVMQDINDKRLYYFCHESNRGASAARNTGIMHAKGELIAFLDDDDEWLPNKVEKQVSLIQSLPTETGMVYCWMDYYEGDKKISERYPELRGDIFKFTLESQPIGNASTLLVRRSVVENIGGFDESLPRGNDGDFIRRVCQRYKVDFVPEVLVKVYIGHSKIRITRDDNQGLLNAIIGEKAKLTKFHTELLKYPQQTAVIYSKIGLHYSQLGNWKNAVYNLWKSIKLSPTNLRIYKKALRSLIEYFKLKIDGISNE